CILHLSHRRSYRSARVRVLLGLLADLVSERTSLCHPQQMPTLQFPSPTTKFPERQPKPTGKSFLAAVWAEDAGLLEEVLAAG
ncbi:MAG: hypothetical protein ACKPKO_56335, partial [Candidatus Fonsibacter sp.]